MNSFSPGTFMRSCLVAGRHNHRFGLQLAAARRIDDEMVALAGHLLSRQQVAGKIQVLQLALELIDRLQAADHLVVFDPGQRQLPLRLAAQVFGNHQHIQAFADGVYCGSQPGGAAADHDQVIHGHSSSGIAMKPCSIITWVSLRERAMMSVACL